MSDDWLMMDFSLFPNEQKSGLTLEEINKVINDTSINANDQSQSANQHYTNPIGDKQLLQEQLRSVPEATRKRNNWALKLYKEFYIFWKDRHTFSYRQQQCDHQ